MSSTVTELIGKESISDAAEKARKGIRGLSDETKSTSSTTDALSDKTKLLQGIFNGFVVTAVVAGLKKITETAFECYQEFGEMDRRMQQLKIALGNNEESFSRNVDLIESLTQKTLSSKDEIENLIAELASLGKSDSQIQAIATAAVSLANITGKDLNSSFQLLNATYSGTTGRLSQIIPEIKNLTKEQLLAGEAVDLINQKLGPISDELAENNIPQKLKNLKDKFGDLKETLGELVAPLFSPMLQYLQLAIDGWSDLGLIIESTSFKFNALVDSPASVAQAITTLQKLISVEQDNLRDYDRKISDLKATLGGKSSPELRALIEERTRLGQYIQELVRQSQALSSGKKPSEVFNVRPSSTQSSASSIGTDDALTRLLKSNYTIVDKLADSISQILQINENHPEYYSKEQLQGLVASIRGQIYSAETLQLGPEGQSRLQDAKTLFQYLQTLIPEPKIYAESVSNSVSDALNKLYPPIIAGISGGLSFKAQIPSLEEYNNRVVSEYENSNKTYSEYVSNAVVDGMKKVFSPAGMPGGLSFKALVPSIEESNAKMATDYDEYLSDVKTIMKLGSESIQQMYEITIRAPVQSNIDLTNGAVEVIKRYDAGVAAFADDVKSLTQAGAQSLDQLSAIYARQAEDEARKTVQANLDITDTATRKIKEIDSDFQYMYIPPRTPYLDNSILQSWQKPILSPGITGGLSFAANVPTQSEVDQQMVTEYEAYLVDITSLGLAASQSAKQLQETSSKATILTRAFASVISAKDSIQASFASVKESTALDATGQLNSMISSIMSALGPFGQMIAGVNPVMAVLLPILQGFADVVSPLVSTVLAPLMGILRTIGTFLGTILSPIISALSPIITALAQGFVWFYNNVMLPVGNAIITVGNWMYNAIAKTINFLLGWIGVHLDTISLDSGTLSKISLEDLASAGLGSYTGSGGSGSTASYTKPRDINVYVTVNTDALVGSDGISEFALIIGRELKSAGVLGVT